MNQKLNKLLLIFLFITVNLFSALAQTGMVNTATLNLRSESSTNGDILEKLNYGDTFTIITDLSNGWVKINSNGTEGYVLKKYTTISHLGDKNETNKSNSNESNQHQNTKAVNETSVLICNSNSAYAYHKYQCRGLSRCRHTVSKVSVGEAKRLGYVPCKICY
jgi:uncharacterized protein YgiM (DUF1202 family)